MIWRRAHRFYAPARELADRHYNRQTPGAPQFAPTGSCFVLYADNGRGGRAFWITSWPLYAQHAWPGAWVCSAFRNEGAGRASDLIRDAVAATRLHYGEPPAIGMITMVDRDRVRPTKVRGEDVWGWSYLKAGFRPAGETKVRGHLVLQLLPADMPQPAEFEGYQPSLFGPDDSPDDMAA